jgi:predicted 3-demethylubiquinone-9 3-methyltransferase (glyoxalase superfamily)
MQKPTTCLWFDDQSQEAVTFYVSLFPNSRIVDTKHYLEGAHRPAGSVLTDKYGVSWQSVPKTLLTLLDTADKAASQRAFSTMLKMAKLDIAALQRAYDGA